MTRDHASTRLPDELLEALRAAEPGGMVACEPALGDTVAPLRA